MRRRLLRRIFAAIGAVLAASYIVLLFTNKTHYETMDKRELDNGSHRKIAVFGATGTIGDGLLEAALADPDIRTIHVVTRRPSPRIEEGVATGKVEMTILTDYLDYSVIRDTLAVVDAVYWAIGLSAVGLDEETYRRIHTDFPVQLVSEWLEVSDKAGAFHYVSGSGADADSRMMWAREKARAEARLAELVQDSGLRVVSYRPAFIRPTEAEVNAGHKILHALFAPIGYAVRAVSIGEAMLEVDARRDQIGNGSILENKDILGLSKAYATRHGSDMRPSATQ